jgi:hypothetical protein
MYLPRSGLPVGGRVRVWQACGRADDGPHRYCCWHTSVSPSGFWYWLWSLRPSAELAATSLLLFAFLPGHNSYIGLDNLPGRLGGGGVSRGHGSSGIRSLDGPLTGTRLGWGLVLGGGGDRDVSRRVSVLPAAVSSSRSCCSTGCGGNAGRGAARGWQVGSCDRRVAAPAWWG